MVLTKRRHDIDMTKGSILRNIVLFTLPLLAGNLFQQLYNMVDTWVIGQTGENGAYAAVGSVAPIINILIGFFSGLASGAGVVISQYYGAKDEERVKRATHTALVLTVVLGVALTAVGILMTPPILRMMLHTDGAGDAVFAAANNYLTIYFIGLFPMMVYNMGAGILRAVGDSQRPFYFLVVSAVTNILLDLLFVFEFGMREDGVAWATVIAQTASAILMVIALLRTPTWVRMDLKALKVDWPLLRKIVKIGIPAALQMAITAFSNVFVQSYVANVAGDKTYSLAGWTSYTKVDHFLFLPVQSIALAVTTFVGQNLGSGDSARARRGIWVSFRLALCINAVLIALVMIFAGPLAGIFNDDPNVVRCAKLLLTYVSPFYMLTCINQIFASALRGAGNTRAPMLIMLGTFVGFRQLYLFIMSNYISNELLPIAMGYPAGWLACSICMLLYYRFFSFGKTRVVEEA